MVHLRIWTKFGLNEASVALKWTGNAKWLREMCYEIPRTAGIDVAERLEMVRPVEIMKLKDEIKSV